MFCLVFFLVSFLSLSSLLFHHALPSLCFALCFFLYFLPSSPLFSNLAFHTCVFLRSRMFFVLILLFSLLLLPYFEYYIDILQYVFIEYFSILLFVCFCFQFVLCIIMKILESTMSRCCFPTRLSTPFPSHQHTSPIAHRLHTRTHTHHTGITRHTFSFFCWFFPFSPYSL